MIIDFWNLFSSKAWVDGGGMHTMEGLYIWSVILNDFRILLTNLNATLISA